MTQNFEYNIDNFTDVDGQIIAKEYFTALGHRHTAIDLNGKEDSISFDLRKSIIESKYSLIGQIQFWKHQTGAKLKNGGTELG